jgi:chromosomal replication initiator protein
MSKSSARPVTETEFTIDNLQLKWKKCLELIKDEISPQGFRTWLSPIIPVSYVDEILILRVPSQFFFEWLETHYQDKVLDAVKKIYGLRTKIEYLVASTPDKPIAALNDNAPSEVHIPNNNIQTNESHDCLDSRYRFENFIVRNDNELALRAAQTVARNPGKTDFNPL